MADEALFPRYLPEDLISNILLRLPIRSLLVCTSISKPWNSFIKSSAFISSHLKHKETDSDLCLLQICPVSANTGTDLFFLRLKDREMSEYDRLQSPIPSDQPGYQVVSSCNGIVCLTRGRFYSSSPSRQWILWNPAIRKTMVISERHNAKVLEAGGLGFDSKTGDFKVLSIKLEEFRDRNLMVHLYSLKANSWKRLPDLDYMHTNSSMRREMAFVNGVLHFVGRRSYRKQPEFVILVFDLADEVFHEIMLPDCMANENDDHFVSTCGESLSVLWLKDGSMSNMEIWVMKEYGLEESWTKLSTVRLDSSLDYMELSISGLVFKDDSNVILSVDSYYSENKDGMIFSHDLKTQETKEIEIGGNNTYCYLGNYVESLVILDVKNEQKPSEVESDDGIIQMKMIQAFYLGVSEEAGLRVPGFGQHFEVEPDDGDSTSASSSSYDIGSLYDCGDLGDDGIDASAGSSSYGVGSLYDHGDLGDEETADIERDSGESDSSSHASDE